MLLVACAALFVIAGAQAVHETGAFELDGNAVSANAATPFGPADDWDRVCHQVTITNDAAATPPNVIPDQCVGATDTNGATSVSWVAEPNPNSSIFTGGGSKDPQDINQWAWKDAGGLPDKDNLIHGFAARYSRTGTVGTGNCPNGTDANGGTFDPSVKCEVVFFGSDRFDNSGDAQQGVWLFQKKIELGTNSVGGGSGFKGLHTLGDILVISDFSNGGGTATMTVYKWNPAKCVTGKESGCGDANLELLKTSDAASCANVLLGANDAFCGIVNSSNGTFAPWDYTDKTGNHTYLQGELYEGGINLSLLGLGGECFSTIGSETRSSTSTTATLKDFILEQFSQCSSTMTTTPTGAGPVGSNGTATISDSATINVKGGANPPAPTGNVLFYLCSSQTSISTCDATGALKATIDLATATKNGNNYTVGSGNFSVSAGYYCWFSTWSGDSNYSDGASHDGADECLQITPRQPALHTAVSDAGPVNPGTAEHDTVTFDTAPVTPSNGVFGTITFNVYGPEAASGTHACSALVATFTSTVQAGVVSYNSGNVSPTGIGFYNWTASYAPGAGDVNNRAVSVSACGAANEQFEVKQFQPALTTAQTVTINDSATITVTGGGPLAGTAHIRPFSDSSCTSGNELAADQALSVSGDSPQTVSTTAMTITSTGAHTIYWQVSYTSTNASQKSIAASCTENSSITITN
jgi:hypothetical protein